MIRESSTVSIRAPVRTPGRLAPDVTLRPPPAGFNPRPGANTGATSEEVARMLPSEVSIRAPVRTPGRLSNSAAGATGPRSFNPRPGANTGATGDHAGGQHPVRGFNPRPGANTGATWGRSPHLIRTSFQSAPRCEHRGDPLGQRISAALSRFQSAPRCEHRGDWSEEGHFLLFCCFNPRPGANTGATT